MFVRGEKEEERKKKKKKRGWGKAVVVACHPPPRFLAPVVVMFLQRNSASDYLAVVSTRTRVQSLHLLATCVYQMLWRASMAPPSTSRVSPPLSISYTLSCYSSPRCQNLLLFSAMSLCYAYAYAYAYATILRSASPPVAYLSTGTIHHVLTARCLSAAYPGIQQMVLISFPRNSLCPYLQ